ncbi:MAG: uL15 family ribosomal protein [Candidatus Marsarchaeota archaeon]|nr:uL15 family ribosomal protein [Candidatus Marsarchaeota archaeon]
MTTRPGKRNRKFLGSRSHGKGNAKNKRGKGGKGGWGRAGMHKHRFSYVTTHERLWMKKGGHFGFTNPNRVEPATLNLWNIEQMAQAGKLKKEGNGFAFDFEGKILGTGPLNTPVLVRALAASKSAIERIAAAGGKFELVAPKEMKETGGIKKDNRGRSMGEGAKTAEGAKPAGGAKPAIAGSGEPAVRRSASGASSAEAKAESGAKKQ